MKLSFSTIGCPDWTFDEMVANAARWGYQGIELRGIRRQLRTEELPPLLPQNQAATRALLKENNVAICGIGTSVLFEDPANFNAAVAEGRAAIDICRQMEVPFIRVFGDHFPTGEAKESVWARLARGIGALCEYAENGPPVQVLLEIHGHFNTAEALQPLFQQLGGHPAFGVIWDIANSHAAHGDDFLPFYGLIRPFIRHVHVKDCRFGQGAPVYVAPGRGALPLRAIIRRLLADGYGGYFSFEWEKLWHPELAPPEEVFPQYIAFMQQFV